MLGGLGGNISDDHRLTHLARALYSRIGGARDDRGRPSFEVGGRCGASRPPSHQIRAASAHLDSGKDDEQDQISAGSQLSTRGIRGMTQTALRDARARPGDVGQATRTGELRRASPRWLRLQSTGLEQHGRRRWARVRRPPSRGRTRRGIRRRGERDSPKAGILGRITK
jgi:hypothetical protein